MAKTLYRAASTPAARKGAHFSPDLETAEAYQDNPGFGGPRLYRYEVSPDHHLDLYKVAKRRGDAEALRVLAEEIFEAKEADTKLQDWRDAGYRFVFQVFENDGKTSRKAAENYDWISYVDDFPMGAETWRYFGDATLEGASISSAHAVKKKTGARLDAEISAALARRYGR